VELNVSVSVVVVGVDHVPIDDGKFVTSVLVENVDPVPNATKYCPLFTPLPVGAGIQVVS
jgi:hypothetical protein